MVTERIAGEWSSTVARQAALVELGQLGLGAADVDAVLQGAMAIAATTLEVSDVALFEVRADRRGLQARAAYRGGRVAPVSAIEAIRVPSGRGSLPGFAVSTGGVVASGDLLADTRFRSQAPSHASPVRAGVAATIAWEDQPWGTLAVYDGSPRHWTDDEVRFVQSVATTMGLAVQRAGIEGALRDASMRLDLSLVAGGLGAWSWNVDTDQITLSPSAGEVLGIDAAAFSGQGDDFVDVVHPDDRAGLLVAVDTAIGSQAKQHHLFRVTGDDVTVRWIEAWGQEMHDRTGHHLVGVFADVTARQVAQAERDAMWAREQEARREAERSHEQLRFLSEASRRLGESLELATILDDVVDLCVPFLADVCLVDLVEDSGILVEHGARAIDGQSLAEVRALRRRRVELGGVGGIWSEAQVATRARTLLRSELTDGDFMAAACDDDHLALFRRFGATSAVIAPLAAAGRVIGVMSLLRNRTPHTYDEADLGLIEEVCARAALAIDNGRLFESRTRVARSLQTALLPPALPSVAGLVFATRYEVADVAAEIGGDFYDVFEIGPRRVGVVLGDVCGRGPEAAALTGLVRHTMRSAVRHRRRPSAVLAATNSAILPQIDDARFCTVAYLRVTAPEGGAGAVTAVAASAGHPRPALVCAGGGAELVDCGGTLLGVVEAPNFTEVEVVLQPGDALVLYTDGVTEARRGRELFGDGRLLDALDALAGRDAEAIAGGVQEAVAAFRSEANDDIAIMVVQAGSPVREDVTARTR